jgi:hypothetical protein
MHPNPPRTSNLFETSQLNIRTDAPKHEVQTPPCPYGRSLILIRVGARAHQLMRWKLHITKQIHVFRTYIYQKREIHRSPSPRSEQYRSRRDQHGERKVVWIKDLDEKGISGMGARQLQDHGKERRDGRFESRSLSPTRLSRSMASLSSEVRLMTGLVTLLLRILQGPCCNFFEKKYRTSVSKENIYFHCAFRF